MYVSSAGLLYIVDAERHFLYRYDLNTSDIISTADSVGGRGTRSTQFSRPVFVDASNDLKIFVSDSGNNRIQLFDRRFQPLGSVALTSRASGTISYTPGAIVFNSFGELIFWDEQAGRLRKITALMHEDPLFNPAVTMLRASPVSIVSSAEGFVLADAVSGKLFRYSSTGRYLGFWALDTGIRDVVWHRSAYYVLYSNRIILLESNGSIRHIVMLNSDGGVRIAAFGDSLIVADQKGIFCIKIDSSGIPE
jgi:hypothetical protein